MFNKLEQKMTPIANWLTRNKILTAIKDGFLITTPLIIIGSLFLLVANFPIPGYSEFVSGILGEGWESHFTVVSRATFNVIALLNVLCIGYAYGKQNEVDPIAAGVLSLVAYLIITPSNFPDFVNADGGAFNGFSFANLNSQGIFLAMITAIVSGLVFAKTTKRGWVIKLPDGVPPEVMRSFAALIPSAIVMIIFFLVRWGFTLTSFQTAQGFIYEVLQAPMAAIADTSLFEIGYQFFSSLFWFFGINGPAVTNTVSSPIHNIFTLGNLTAHEAGLPLPYIFTGPFSDFFANFGGGGSTLSLVIVMLFFGKSQRVKELGKLSILPGIFGINEMIIFGLPIVLNPIMLIPFLFVPVMNTVLSTLATMWNIIPYTTGISLGWTTPIFFSGWLATGSVVAGIFQLFLLVLGCLVYYPFFKILDKQYLVEEQSVVNKVIDEVDDLSLDDLSFD